MAVKNQAVQGIEPCGPGEDFCLELGELPHHVVGHCCRCCDEVVQIGTFSLKLFERKTIVPRERFVSTNPKEV
jgi:hypothetical protein